MTTKKGSKKKTTDQRKSRSRTGKSTPKQRAEDSSPITTNRALAHAAEALARAAEALARAVNAHLGVTGSSRSLELTAAEGDELQGNCLDLSTAGQIVENAVNSSKFDIDRTLEQMDLISPSQRRIFQQDVLNSVRSLGCQINDGDVPNAAGDTARTVRDTIQARARQ